MTTKAQEVRKKGQQHNDQFITQQAQKIFDWILDLMDENLNKNYLGEITLSLKADGYAIRPLSNEPSFSLLIFLSQYGTNAIRMRIPLFQQLKKIVEQEEGFEVSLDTSKSGEEIVITISIVH